MQKMMSKKLSTTSSTTSSLLPQRNDKVILLGDFNARVRKEHKLWAGTIRNEEVEKRINNNGLLLLTKCAKHDLVMTS